MRKDFREYNKRAGLYGPALLPTHEDRLYVWIHRIEPPRHAKGSAVIIDNKDLKRFAKEIMKQKDQTLNVKLFDDVMKKY